MDDTPPRLLAIVVKAPSEVEANVLASRLAYLATFQAAFKNGFEPGWVARGIPHGQPQEHAPDLEDLEIERQHLAARIAELEAQLAVVTVDRDAAERTAARYKATLALLTPGEEQQLLYRHNNWKPPIERQIGGVIPPDGLEALPDGWRLDYEFIAAGGQYSQGWVASTAITGGWLATEPNRDERATVAAAWALAGLGIQERGQGEVKP